MLTQLIILAICGLRAPWYVAALGWLGSLGAVAIGGSRIGSLFFTANETGNLVVFASVGFGLVVASCVARQWQLIRTQLTAERNVSAAEAARRQLVEERAGIARELHDVVAHGMSLVTVQATTARYRYPGMDEKVAAEFEEIAEHSRRAMTEMRHMLGVLRAENTDKETVPQPGAADLKALVESIRRAGIAVDISTPAGFDPGPILGLTVYRIVQEALSNVVRHAPDSRATVRITQPGERIVVLVQNRPAVLNSSEHSGGHGLIGMQERVQVMGGTLRYGPTDDGGFQVEARLPRILGPATNEKAGKRP
nr:sensor histidine kinase [Psychromicrobium silvestre]